MTFNVEFKIIIMFVDLRFAQLLPYRIYFKNDKVK